MVQKRKMHVLIGCMKWNSVQVIFFVLCFYSFTNRFYYFKVIPLCEMHRTCASCAESLECAWCGSTNECLTIFDTFTKPECKSVVYDPPCPKTFIEDTVLHGNLRVIGDNLVGGGSLQINGPCTSPGCREGNKSSLVLDNGEVGFEALSGGAVTMEAADSSFANGHGHNVTIEAGDGTNVVGGKGGSLWFSAGNGRGDPMFGGDIGHGGNVNIASGNSSSGYAGNVSLIGGTSFTNGTLGGSINIVSGTSANSSGHVQLCSPFIHNGTTGNIDIETE